MVIGVKLIMHLLTTKFNTIVPDLTVCGTTNLRLAVAIIIDTHPFIFY